MAARAVFHEFGVKKRNLPSRPFFRQAIARIDRRMPLLIRKAYRSTDADVPMGFFNRLGMQAASMVQRSITLIQEPPLSEVTIMMKEEKGLKPPHNPLIETGKMRGSVTWVVKRRERTR